MAKSKGGFWRNLFGGAKAESPTRAIRVASRRNYEAASLADRTGGWGLQSKSANGLLSTDLRVLRDRSRDLRRNDPHGKRVIAEIVSSLVGTGIVPRADTGDQALNDLIDAEFQAWSETCETSGQLDYAGCQIVACTSFVESGEVLVRRRVRNASDGMGPFQLQILESDMLDSKRNEELGGGARIIQGVELSPLDRRQAYWIFPSHPGEPVSARPGVFESQRISADQIIHIHETERPGQVRGVPWLHAVINKLHDLGDYEDAELTRKKIESAVVAMVIAADDEEDTSITPLVEDSDGNVIEGFYPGMIGTARGSKDVKFSQPTAIGGYAEYKRAQLQSAAAGARTTYEAFSGDLSQVNFSSIRAGQIGTRRILRQVQQSVIIFLFCRRAWRWFIDGLILTGKIKDSPNAYRVRQYPPRIEEVDRLREAQADDIEMGLGISTLPDIIAARGGDPETAIPRLEKYLQDLAKRKIRLPKGPTIGGADGGVSMDAKKGGETPRPAA